MENNNTFLNILKLITKVAVENTGTQINKDLHINTLQVIKDYATLEEIMIIESIYNRCIDRKNLKTTKNG